MSNKANRKALLISIGCMFFQQASGINTVIFYMSNIFGATESVTSSNTFSIIVAIVQVCVHTYMSLLLLFMRNFEKY